MGHSENRMAWFTRVFLACVFTAGLLAATPSPTWAAARSWTGAINSDWYIGFNWSPVGGPFEDDQLSVFSGTITGSQSPVVRDGGSILLDGANTDVSFPALWFLNVGETGTGTVTVRNGADLTSFNVTMVADDAGSDGDLFVQGAGSTLTTDSLWVGINGLGFMEISGGGYVTSTDGIIAMNSGAANSRALVTGIDSTWDMGTGSFKTLGGLGFLDVEAGGKVISGEGRIGVNGGRGEVTITGAGSQWTSSGSIDVGRFGAGSLTITAGGTVSATDMGVHSLSHMGQGTSDVTVDGTGSRFDVDTTVNVGKGFGITNTGPGSVTVRNSGVFDAGGTLTIFNEGTVNVESGGSLFADVLDRAGGTLNTFAGSQLYANQLVGFSGTTIIGGSLNMGHSGGTGGFSVGAGELLFINRGLVVGLDNGSTALVTASNGGRLDTGIASIGAFSGSQGEVVVNPGSSWFNVDLINVGLIGDGTLNVTGGSILTARLELGQSGGNGTVNVSNGGIVTANTVRVGANSTFNLSDGKLDADTILRAAGSGFNFTGGTLRVGFLQGALTQSGGTLTPGNGLGSTLISSGFDQQAGTLEIELAGSGGVVGTDFDQFRVFGDITLAGALEVSLFGGFTPTIGESFDVVTFTGSRTGTFSSVIGATEFNVTYGLNVITLTAQLLGDMNGDGFVGVDDLNIILLNWNQTVPAGSRLHGDQSGDGFIGVDDLNIILINWNNGTPPVEVSANIPEPGAVVMLGVGGLALLRRRTAC